MKNLETVELLRKLEAINSPSGYTKDAIAFLADLFRAAGLTPRLTNKGALLVCEHPEPVTVCAAHVDTLGAMVTKLEGDGTLRVTQVGGWPVLNVGPLPLDTDRDGMPDYWEKAVGLNPNNSSVETSRTRASGMMAVEGGSSASVS